MPHPFLKRFILLGVLLAGYWIFFNSSADNFFSWRFLIQHYATIKDFVHYHRWLSYLSFCCAYVVAVAFSLPIASLLSLTGGAIFGWPATALVVGSATIGAGVVFLAARYIFTDMLRRRAGPFLIKLEEGFLQNAFFYLLALRLVPVAPFWVVNIIPALTRMGLAQFLIATFLGIIPGTCIYVWVGRGFDGVLAAHKTPNLEVLADPNVLLPLTGFALLALLPVFARGKIADIQNRKNQKKTN